MKKKVLSLVLALLMTASAASTVLADDVVAISEEPVVVEEVSEVAEAGQYDKAIEFLANYGIFKGYNADDTGAEDLIQRYQMALFVGRISTGWVEDEQWEDGPENWSEFSDIDVDPVNKYYGALSYANQKGIIEGYGNGKFGPTDSIKYQDALTMVVRTLGYTGLDWPWGYIQKAVELGLTDGITGVAYTDELTRGEVAQIIYNALFATTKSGTTLAMSSFGIEFGWEKIVVTASDLNTFVADKKEAKKALKNDTTPYFKDSNKPAAGFVTFQLLNDDGSLADDVYYVQASELGLAGDHDDELAVGEAYYVLFEKDEDSNLAKVVAYESLKVDTLVNAGKTDDEGEEQEYAIQEFLADYTLVDKFTGKNYVNVTASTKLEMMVYATTGSMTETVVNGNLIAIDWDTGDILVPVDADKDGEWDTNEDDELIYKVEWSYNTILNKYYQIDFDEKYDEIGINWMSDKEFEDTYEKYIDKEAKTVTGFATTVASIAKSAYAELEIYDTDLNGVADRAIYESFRLGKFSESTTSDSKSYKISSVGTLTNAAAAAATDDAYSITNIATFNTIQEGVKDADVADRAWFVEGYEPEIAYDEDGEATGYKAGYVIYNYDAETGAIKVVKNIEDGSDEDTFVSTGVVRAYNINKGTVTIGDTVYSIDQYDELEGNGFKYATADAETKACYTGLLRNLFNQFVKYVVVDGELVHIEACGATKAEVIVVDSYAGIDKEDGYIVVNGYSTSDLEYAEFRIANYNNWLGGDYFYYLDEDKAEASFTKGAIYAISSYDEEEDLYYVQLAGAFDGDDYVVNTEFVNLNAVTITEEADGYAKVVIDGTSERKMKSSDKYVIVLEEAEKNPYAPVIVYEGKLGEGWKVEGDIINTTDENAGTYVIVNATVVGFADTYKTGLALYLGDKYYSASSSENLLGATSVEVYAFDLLNGANVVYTATNKILKDGHVYFTQNNVLVEDNGIQTLADIWTIAQDVYANETADTTAYGFGTAVITADNYKDLFNVKDNNADEKLAVEAIGLDFFGVSKFYSDLIGDFAVMAVEYDEDEDVITAIDTELKVAEFEEIVEDATAFNYNVYFVYNAATAKVVAYVDIVDATGVATSEEGTTDEVVVWEDETYADGAYIEATVDYTANYVDGVLKSATINAINFTFAGDYVDSWTHANCDALDWHFGREGECTLESVIASIKIDGEEITPVGSSIVETLYECDEDCNLVKAISITLADEVVIDDAGTGSTIEVNFANSTSTSGIYNDVELDTINFNVRAYTGEQIEENLVNEIVLTVVAD